MNAKQCTFKGFLGDRVLFVPQYQRPYSWKDEHWHDLWSDIEEVESSGVPHYMGALVVMESDDDHHAVIDGQQRLATLSILILAAVQMLRDLAAEGAEPDQNHEREDLLRSKYIGTKDTGSLVEASRLTLGRSDDSFYQGTLVQLAEPVNERKLGDSTKLMWRAFQFFSDKLSKRFAGKDGRDIAEWVDRIVARQLMFIEVSVADEVSAYTLFLNTQCPRTGTNGERPDQELCSVTYCDPR